MILGRLIHIDQHDYQNLVGQYLIPPGVWSAVARC